MAAYYKTCKNCGGPNYSQSQFCRPCNAERKRERDRKYLVIYRKDKRRQDHGVACYNCPALALCQVEIKRPDFWPPCMPASRFYDPSLRAKIEPVQFEEAAP